MPNIDMKVINLQNALKHLSKLSAEIRHQSCFEEKRFTSGLIAFRFHRNSDRKQINHKDKDVVCHVLKGRGRLRIDGRRIPLRSGMICHIPKRTPHDFAAGKRGELVLFYSLIKTG
jgi:mannose-6-phosphate isomerase-like protein (cupin superfamily)